ncbi:MAG: PIN domain-containing protein [Opitutaceae bacterium]|nr:PIN domain-containing protein [Opitutaceae bacterium]
MITHVFDTSAILAHYFHEPGAELVNELLADNSAEVGIPAIELLELKRQLNRTLPDATEAQRAFRLYADELIAPIPVTREIVARALLLIERMGDQLSPSEAILAATAQHEGAILVHRTAPLAVLPANVLRQCALPLGR